MHKKYRLAMLLITAVVAICPYAVVVPDSTSLEDATSVVHVTVAELNPTSEDATDEIEGAEGDEVAGSSPRRVTALGV